MSAPDTIYAAVHYDGRIMECGAREPMMQWIRMQEDGDIKLKTYVPASELAAVQARLDKLVEAAEYMRDDICEGEHDEAMLKLRSAITAAKGGE